MSARHGRAWLTVASAWLAGCAATPYDPSLVAHPDRPVSATIAEPRAAPVVAIPEPIAGTPPQPAPAGRTPPAALEPVAVPSVPAEPTPLAPAPTLPTDIRPPSAPAPPMQVSALVAQLLAHAAADWGVTSVGCAASEGAVLPGGAPVDLAWRGADDAEVEVVLARADGGSWTELDFEPGPGGVAAMLPESTIDVLELAVVLVRGGMRRLIAIPGVYSTDFDPPTTPPTEPRFAASTEVELEVRPVDRGRAGVARLRLWFQAKPHDPWRAIREDEVGPDFRAAFSYRLALERDGAYGFRVTAVDRAGNAEPDPLPGDPPAHTIELDRAAPVVRLDSTRSAADPASVVLTWRAEDPWLEPAGASLFRSVDGDRWTLVAGGLAPTGTWTEPAVAASSPAARYRVVVADRAGNLGAAEMPRR